MQMQKSALAGVAWLLAQVVLIGEAVAICTAPIGTIVSLQGLVEVQRAGDTRWQVAHFDAPLCAGDTVRVGERSRAEASLVNQPKFRIDQNSTLRLVRQTPENKSLIELLSGVAYFFSRRPRSLDVYTPLVSAAVEGTEFLVEAAADRTVLTVFEGKIVATSDAGGLTVTSGQSAVVEPDRPPVPYPVLQPWTGVAWALFYPPLLPDLLDAAPAAGQGADPLREAMVLAGQRRTTEAFERFDAVPASERGVDFLTSRAAVLLSVGRSDEAQTDLDQALLVDPASGTAHALRSIIALAQNDPAAATLADRAVDLAPAAAAPRIARSHVRQRQGRLEPAVADLRQAVSDEPGNALAWARLAEVSLAVGRRAESRQASAEARALSPQSASVLTVDGFTALAEFDTRAARQAFEAAVAADPGHPLPRFGLGLATIRDGDLEAGREQIELAVALDPGNALYRAYLGKAYFEERRPALAGAQFGLAKDLDPGDPTAYYFDALLKQSQNRPVEALRDIEAAIERNDNRLPFRSRELLNSDRAARGTSLARIYSDLGFQQLAVDEAARSLALDPASPSAHRFLADTYATQRRNEIGRVSELLQAQLFQDININPVQPSLNVTGLDIFSGGPFRIGLNEYTPLFERNRAQLNLTGQVGNNNTWANEAVVSGVYDWFSISGGQFFYTSDGFRQNADITNKVYNLFTQAALSPQVNVQAEFLSRSTDSGDRELNYKPGNYQPGYRQDINETMARGGLRYSPTPRTNVLASFIFNDFDEDQKWRPALQFYEDIGLILQNPVTARLDADGYQYESQVTHDFGALNIIAGFGVYHINNLFNYSASVPLFNLFSSMNSYSEVRQQTGYVYANAAYPEPVSWTFGLAFDHYEAEPLLQSGDESIDENSLNPKLGVQWQIFDNLSVNAAVFRTLKRALVTNRTIEPTQIASFDQFYDDFNGATAWNYAAGLNARLLPSVYAGSEFLKRRLSSPTFSGTEAVTSDLSEDIYRGYLKWIPVDEWVLSAEIIYDIFKRHDNDADFPEKVNTLTIPCGLRYFSPVGIFAGASVNFTYQDVKDLTLSDDSVLDEADSTFVTLDALLGYRLPNRRGLVSLEVRNLLDKRFNYQDDNFQNGNIAALSPFIPERTILASLSLTF